MHQHWSRAPAPEPSDCEQWRRHPQVVVEESACAGECTRACVDMQCVLCCECDVSAHETIWAHVTLTLRHMR